MKETKIGDHLENFKTDFLASICFFWVVGLAVKDKQPVEQSVIDFANALLEQTNGLTMFF